MLLSTINLKSLMLDVMRVSPEGIKYRSFRVFSLSKWINANLSSFNRISFLSAHRMTANRSDRRHFLSYTSVMTIRKLESSAKILIKCIDDACNFIDVDGEKKWVKHSTLWNSTTVFGRLDFVILTTC